MIPIEQLLNRIKWDEEFGKGNFVVGYYDRVLDRIIQISFAEILMQPGNHQSFSVMDAEGVIHSIPFHRVRQVYKNNELIWSR